MIISRPLQILSHKKMYKDEYTALYLWIYVAIADPFFGFGPKRYDPYGFGLNIFFKEFQLYFYISFTDHAQIQAGKHVIYQLTRQFLFKMTLSIAVSNAD